MSCKGCNWWKDEHPAHPKIFKGQPCVKCGRDTTNPWFTKCYPNCDEPFLRHSRDETKIEDWNPITGDYRLSEQSGRANNEEDSKEELL